MNSANDAVDRTVTLRRSAGCSWGLSLTAEGKKHVVEEIVSGSPGDKAGVLAGDTILVSSCSPHHHPLK